METNNSGKKVGPIIGALIIVIILVIAALYTWGSRLNKNADMTSEEQADAAIAVETRPAVMSNSDDTDSLSKDLDAVNTVEADAAF